MNTSSILIGSAIGAAIFATGNVVDIATGPQHEPRVLTVAQLFYADGNFTQQIVSESGNPISAFWSVQVSRSKGGRLMPLCSGSSDTLKPNGEPIGNGIYNGDIDTFSTDDWVGADCPDLESGDRAEVIWEYTNHYGILTSVGATYVIP